MERILPTTTRHEWRDDGNGGVKPVVVEYEVREKEDGADLLKPLTERDWDPENDTSDD